MGQMRLQWERGMSEYLYSDSHNPKWQIGQIGHQVFRQNKKNKMKKNVNFMDSVLSSDDKKVEIKSILNDIKSGRWKSNIDKIHELRAIGEGVEFDKMKRELPVFTISATFNGKRRRENAEKHTGLVHLDYDKLVNVQEVKSKVMELPFTYAAFVSPSGQGLKVLVSCDVDIDSHTHTFNCVRKHYDDRVGVESDKSVKDILRLCFVSYDEDLYLNDNPQKFITQLGLNSTVESNFDVSDVWSWTERNMNFEEGNRNNFIYHFACNANRRDCDINLTIGHALNYSNSTFPDSEIKETIEHAYKANAHEKGVDAQSANYANSKNSDTSSPYVPEHIYDKLPPTLKEACVVFKGRERDVFLTSALSVISGGLHNICGLYSQDEVFPNLYSFIVAPPASGKGSMKYARQLGGCYHEFLYDQTKEASKTYKREKRLFDLKVKKAKTPQDIEALSEPEKPISKVFYIPGNVSSSMLINHLADNDGIGCICETEADTVTNTLSKEWGGYSDILRKGFHGEPISKSRVMDLIFTEIKEPKFSVVLTGTPNQMDSLIPSVHDGLFSRFLYYSFTSKPRWIATYTTELNQSNKQIFQTFSAALCDKFKSNETRKFVMTKEQGEKLDQTFKEALNHNSALYSDYVQGNIKRLGLMTYKIAMVLSALRSDTPHLTCSAEDFDIAMVLVAEVYLKHSVSLLDRLNKQSNKLNIIQQELYDWVKTKGTFKRAQIEPLATSLGIKPRTLTDLLNKLIDKKLIKRIKHGVYSQT